MSIFPLDTVQNARMDRDVDLVLEDVREDVVRFPFSVEAHGGDTSEVVRAYDMSRPRLNVIASLLRQLSPGHGADISTGLGFLPVALRHFGLTTIATDRHPAIAGFAATHGIEVRQFAIGSGPPPITVGSLDFVIFAEVLEHLNMPPIRVLREIASLLRPGAKLILTTPNIARLAHLELLASGENFLEQFPEDTPAGGRGTDGLEHVREYSVREVVDAIEATGLSVDRVLMTGWGDSGYDLVSNPYGNEIIVVEATS